MKNRNLIAYAILAVCWEQLLHHVRGFWQGLNPDLWIDKEHYTVSAIQNGPEYVGHNINETKEILLKWITDWLDESKIVILYTCGDNAEIALHRPKDFTEDLSILDYPEDRELTNILYMAYD